jgi:hypothetical protein
MKRLILLSLVLPGCVGEPDLRGPLPIPIFWVDARIDTSERGSFDRIDEACKFWGLVCEDSDEHDDAITLVLTDYGGLASDDTHKLGYAFYDPCEAVIWSFDDSVALEHELGHTFTLQHVDTHDNVMFPSLEHAGDTVTLRQRVAVDDAASLRCE